MSSLLTVSLSANLLLSLFPFFSFSLSPVSPWHLLSLSPSLSLFFISVFIYPAVSLPNSFALSLSLTLSIYLSPFLYFSLFLPIYLSLSLSLLCLLLLYCRRLPRITISICENETRKGWESFLGTKNLGGCVEFRRISTFKCGWKKSKRFRCDRKNCERFRNQSYR